MTPDPAGEESLGGEAHEEEGGFRRLLKGDGDTPPDTGSGKGKNEGEAPPAGDAPPPAPKYKVGDLEFDSEEQAVHKIKTYQGQAAAVDRRHREITQLQQSVIQALAQAGMTLNQDGTVTRAANAPAPAPTANIPAATPQGGRTTPASLADVDLSSPEGVQTILDSALDWKQLPALIDYYEGQHGKTIGPAVALRLVMESVIPKLAESITGQQRRMVEPLQNMAHSVQAANAVRDLFVGMKEYTFHDGSPAFPEFANDEGVTEVYNVWLDMGKKGFPMDFMMSQEGVQMAVSLLRDFKRMQERFSGRPQGQPTVPTPNPPPPAGNPANIDAATAAVRNVMESLDRNRGAVQGDLATGEGQPFRPSGASDDYATRLKRNIANAGGKSVIPGVRFS